MWSNLQTDIFSWVAANPDKSLVVNAVAGSGKTTTIVELARRMPEAGIFLAFNKSIAETLQSKLPPHIKASTMHSLGFSYLKTRVRKIKVDQTKVSSIMRLARVNKDLEYPTCRLVSYAKMTGIGVFCDLDDDFAWLDLWDDWGDEIEIPEGYSGDQIISFAKTFLKKSNEDLFTIDFDDMIYLPLWLLKMNGWELPSHPFIIIDEAQDTNDLQIELIRNMTKRIIAVGDRNQAIYGFRGANYTAMDRIAAIFKAHELPLSISYRCDLAIVREAQALVPHIEARANAAEGEVDYQNHEVAFPILVNSPLDNTLIVCRMNAPLIRLCCQRLKARKPFHCLSDFPSRLQRYVASIESGRSIRDFLRKLSEKHDAKIAELEKYEKHKRIAAEMDRYEAICILAAECATVKDLSTLLKNLMYSQGGPKISTIHKAKGLEAPTVYFYYQDVCPAPWVIDKGNKEDIQQEYNLRYVAITRAEHSLVYINQPEKK